MIIESDEMEIWIGKLLLILETLGDEILDRPRPLAETKSSSYQQSTMYVLLYMLFLGGIFAKRMKGSIGLLPQFQTIFRADKIYIK